MRILHICETIKGGIATWLNMFQSICGDAVENIFVVPQDHADQLTGSGQIITFKRSKRGPRATIALSRAALTAAQSLQPDVIWCQSSYSLGALAFLRMHKIRATYLYCPHGWAQLRYGDSPKKRRLVALSEGRLAGLADVVVNICENDRSLAERSGYGGRHVVVDNALPELQVEPTRMPSPFGSENKRINLLFVGRFERQKGLDILLDALAGAIEHNSALHLHVVGAGVNATEAVRDDLTDTVTFHSWVSSNEISAYYAHAQALVMPSRWEGLPMVLIEALRAGTPVILADVSGLGGLIENGTSGITLPQLDRPTLAKALANLDAEQLEAMRPAARALYETRYSAPRFRAEMLRLLATLPTQTPLLLPRDTTITEVPWDG